MTNSLRLRGTELRYFLTLNLFIHGTATVPDLIDALAHHNFDVGERAQTSPEVGVRRVALGGASRQSAAIITRQIRSWLDAPRYRAPNPPAGPGTARGSGKVVARRRAKPI